VGQFSLNFAFLGGVSKLLNWANRAQHTLARQVSAEEKMKRARKRRDRFLRLSVYTAVLIAIVCVHQRRLTQTVSWAVDEVEKEIIKDCGKGNCNILDNGFPALWKLLWFMITNFWQVVVFLSGGEWFVGRLKAYYNETDEELQRRDKADSLGR
jgi:hypothetical protein